MAATTAGLISFAAALDRYLLRKATWLETGLFAGAALALFWPHLASDLVGYVLLATAVTLQRVRGSRAKAAPAPA